MPVFNNQKKKKSIVDRLSRVMPFWMSNVWRLNGTYKNVDIKQSNRQTPL